MARHSAPQSLPFDLEAAVKAAELRRAAAARQYLGTVTELEKLIDRLSELHGDLESDDALHEALAALIFTWRYVEQELLIVSGGRN